MKSRIFYTIKGSSEYYLDVNGSLQLGDSRLLELLADHLGVSVLIPDKPLGESSYLKDLLRDALEREGIVIKRIKIMLK